VFSFFGLETLLKDTPDLLFYQFIERSFTNGLFPTKGFFITITKSKYYQEVTE